MGRKTMHARHDITKCSCKEDSVVCQTIGFCSLSTRRLRCGCVVLLLHEDFGVRFAKTCPSHLSMKGKRLGV